MVASYEVDDGTTMQLVVCAHAGDAAKAKTAPAKLRKSCLALIDIANISRVKNA